MRYRVKYCRDTLQCVLFMAFGYRRRAFRYIFARLNFPRLKISTITRSPSPNPNPHYPLAKDVAPIPNATRKKKEAFFLQRTSCIIENSQFH